VTGRFGHQRRCSGEDTRNRCGCVDCGPGRRLGWCPSRQCPHSGERLYQRGRPSRLHHCFGLLLVLVSAWHNVHVRQAGVRDPSLLVSPMHHMHLDVQGDGARTTRSCKRHGRAGPDGRHGRLEPDGRHGRLEPDGRHGRLEPDGRHGRADVFTQGALRGWQRATAPRSCTGVHRAVSREPAPRRGRRSGRPR
jgi:hypothetical protein